jgi:hypothetical protein
MRYLGPSHITGGLVAAGIMVSASLALAGNVPSNQQQSASSVSEPGATRQWCDSLPYPYCRDPAPGTPNSGPIYAPRVVQHPIFGN